MVYDHSRKIGNKGDLIKHFALTVAVSGLANKKREFSYLDVHSGRSQYDLPTSGEWKTGIGRYASYCRKEQPLSEALQYFCDVQSLADVHKTRRYPGSSRVILNVLRDLGVAEIRPILCDTNPAVCRDLESQYRDMPSVEIHCTDGYRKGQEVSAVDLVFIDPPDIQDHYRPFMKLVRHCISKGQPFVSWNPLHGNVLQQTLSRNCLSVARLTTEANIPSITVRWTKGWSGQMCGCQMLFSIPGGLEVVEACDVFTKAMEWVALKDSA